MELTMTFPIKQTEEFYAKIILKAVTMKIISFVVKNSTKGKSSSSLDIHPFVFDANTRERKRKVYWIRLSINDIKK